MGLSSAHPPPAPHSAPVKVGCAGQPKLARAALVVVVISLFQLSTISVVSYVSRLCGAPIGTLCLSWFWCAFGISMQKLTSSPSSLHRALLLLRNATMFYQKSVPLARSLTWHANAGSETSNFDRPTERSVIASKKRGALWESDSDMNKQTIKLDNLFFPWSNLLSVFRTARSFTGRARSHLYRVANLIDG